MVQLYIQFRIWFFDTFSLFFIFYPAARGRGAPKDHHSKIFKIHISQKFPWVVFLNRHRSLGFILNLTTSGPFHGPLDNKRASRPPARRQNSGSRPSFKVAIYLPARIILFFTIAIAFARDLIIHSVSFMLWISEFSIKVTI